MSAQLPATRWPWRSSHSPFQVAERLMGDMDRFWGGGSPFGPSPDTVNTSELSRSADGKTYRLQVLVPGFSKDQITVDVSKNHVSIDAVREPVETEFTQLRSAFPTSLSYREQIPANLDASSADAELKDGVLTITVSALSKAPSGNRIEIR